MQSNFRLLCKTARETIPVSAVPLARIRVAAAAMNREPKRRLRALFGASVGTLAVALLAATIVHVTGAHIYLEPSGTMALRFSKTLHVRTLMNPTELDLRDAAAAADFSVQFPTGLPANAPLRQLVMADTSAIMLQYDLPGAWRRSDHQLWIVLANPSAVTGAAEEKTADHFLPLFGPKGKLRARWQIGGEAVIITRSSALPKELDAIKSSMLAHER